MPKRKPIKQLIEELEKRKEKLAKEKQKLQALKKKLESEYRKREARFLIAIGRTILRYGKTIEFNGQKVLVIPINNQAFKEAFKEYEDIVNLNKDFKKWKRFIDEG